MRHSKVISLGALLVATIAVCTWAQAPAVDTSRAARSASSDTVSAAAIAGSKQDPAAL